MDEKLAEEESGFNKGAAVAVIGILIILAVLVVKFTGPRPFMGFPNQEGVYGEYFMAGIGIGVIVMIIGGAVASTEKEPNNEGVEGREEGICHACEAVIPIDSEECPVCGEELSPPGKESKEKEIEKKLSKLEEEESMIDKRAIESALDEGDVEKAGQLLSELEDKYDEYKETISRLEEIDDKLAELSERLASGEITDESFRDAKEGLEGKKHKLEEKLHKLREEVIHEEYEKPF